MPRRLKRAALLNCTQMRRAGGIKPVYKSRAASTLIQGLESLSQEIVVITINYYDLPLESGGIGASKMIITLNNTSRLFPSYPLPLSRRISPLLIFALPLSQVARSVPWTITISCHPQLVCTRLGSIHHRTRTSGPIHQTHNTKLRLFAKLTRY